MNSSRYRSHLLENIIPFWMKHSLDHEHGGYFTGLDRDGAVYDSRKYVWLNGRQVWTLSRLYNEVERRPEWLEAARLGAEFLRRFVFDNHGRCWFSLTREGQPAFFQRKPYGAAFVALGFAEYAKASGDPWYRDKARELFRKVREWIADPSLLGRPAFPAMPATSQLADIYIVLSLALELGDKSAVDEMLGAIEVHYEPQRRLFFESAALDPARRTEYPECRLICPGSIFEISWIFLQALETHPDPAKQKTILDALEGGLEFGWDKDYGGFHYFMDIEGKPTLQLESSMKLWWVHAEAVCALVHAYAATKDHRWVRWLEAVEDYTFSHFPDPEHGEWFGYLDRRGRTALTLKGNNYKGCFHIPRAMLLSAQAIDRMR
jgi:N-acylglucosamine 2-epimerase